PVLSLRSSYHPSCAERSSAMSSSEEPQNGPLESAVSKSVNDAQWLEDSDSAAVELARTYARRIDRGTVEFESGELTSTDYNKVLYLGPHLLNTLRALGATPEERKSLTEGTSTEVNPIDELKRKRRQKNAG